MIKRPGAHIEKDPAHSSQPGHRNPDEDGIGKAQRTTAIGELSAASYDEMINPLDRLPGAGQECNLAQESARDTNCRIRGGAEPASDGLPPSDRETLPAALIGRPSVASQGKGRNAQSGRRFERIHRDCDNLRVRPAGPNILYDRLD